jgi:PAS domain S-box-containing protein
MALFPKTGEPWVLGMHQCSHPRIWTQEERTLFQEIGRRLSDALTSLLVYRDLCESQDFLNSIVELIPNMIFVQEANTLRLVRLNKFGEQLLGYSQAELLALDDYVFFTAQDRESFTANGIVDIPEETIKTRDKGERVLHTKKLPILDKSGQPKYLLGISEDITERRQAEQERRKLDERVSQVQKLEALGGLVAGVAHNINNVLAAIMATASLRENLATEPKDLEAYRIIGTACRRGRDVVKSLTHFAQPTLSSKTPLELHALITEVRVLLENTTRNRIEIIEEFAGEPLWTLGDAGSLSHALMNLCLNSLDAMPAGGTLTLRTAVPETDWIEIFVEDSGEGMTPEVLVRVTEPFFTTKDVGKGTGLGLSMTHGVIKAHGGTLEIASAPGKITTVKIRIPRIPAPTLAPAIQALSPSLGPLSVLLVDDDEDVRYLVSRMLKNAGLQIASVAGGEEALDSLQAGSIPDLIILDQNMPRMNGIQTMERIRALFPHMPILISSGQPDIEEWACFKQPNVAVIAKPFGMSELLAKVAQFALHF